MLDLVNFDTLHFQEPLYLILLGIFAVVLYGPLKLIRNILLSVARMIKGNDTGETKEA